MDSREYNTPSGTLHTALDKLIFSYVEQGYDWEMEHGDIYFTRGDETITAIADFDDFGFVAGYTTVPGKLMRNERLNQYTEIVIAKYLEAGGSMAQVSKEKVYETLKEHYVDFGPIKLEEYINNWEPEVPLMPGVISKGKSR